MGRLFGTDGIRGRVGEPPITPDLMMKLGWAAGRTLVSTGGGEAERGVAVTVASVGAATELAVVRPPGVGRFNDPAKAEVQRLLLHARDRGPSALDLELVKASVSELAADLLVVVAPVEVEGADVVEQA